MALARLVPSPFAAHAYVRQFRERELANGLGPQLTLLARLLPTSLVQTYAAITASDCDE
jgi:hypothetical protein